MAKKKPATKKPTSKKVTSAEKKSLLPQNILAVGERVDEDKNIYISQPVYRQIHRFTKNKTVCESGGVLVGTVRNEFGKDHILIEGFVEAKYSEATNTTLTFTHETWSYIHQEMDKRYSGKKIVGWIHTHPDFGIFLSDYDKFIQENFFGEPHQVAYVIDPIQGEEGFYFWVNGKLEKCKGFYLFDRQGVKLTAIEKTEIKAAANNNTIKNVLIGILSLAVIALLFNSIGLNRRLRNLEENQAASVRITEAMQNWLLNLEGRVESVAPQLQPDYSEPQAKDPQDEETEPTGESEPAEETKPTEETESTTETTAKE